MKIKNAPSSSGFTLVELVMVIILIGVLSALGVGLFAGRSAFSPLLATQQLSSATLLTQQAALAGNFPYSNVHIRQASNEFQFVIGPTDKSDDPDNQVFAIRREGASISYSVDGGSNYESVPGEPGSFKVPFNSMGRPAGPLKGKNIDFEITDSESITFDLCLSSLGAVYQGRCQ